MKKMLIAASAALPLASVFAAGETETVTIPATDFSSLTTALTTWVTAFLPTMLVIFGVGLGVGLAYWGARVLWRFFKGAK